MSNRNNGSCCYGSVAGCARHREEAFATLAELGVPEETCAGMPLADLRQVISARAYPRMEIGA